MYDRLVAQCKTIIYFEITKNIPTYEIVVLLLGPKISLSRDYYLCTSFFITRFVLDKTCRWVKK